MLTSLKPLVPVFLTILLAEMGDKTQLATMLFSADGAVSRWGVFVAASLALITATAVGVLAGAWAARVMPTQLLQTVAGVGFVLIGVWTIYAARA